jgi:hypothetical protein
MEMALIDDARFEREVLEPATPVICFFQAAGQEPDSTRCGHVAQASM